MLGAWRLDWCTGSGFYQCRILFTQNLPVCMKFSPKVVMVAFCDQAQGMLLS